MRSSTLVPDAHRRKAQAPLTAPSHLSFGSATAILCVDKPLGPPSRRRGARPYMWALYQPGGAIQMEHLLPSRLSVSPKFRRYAASEETASGVCAYLGHVAPTAPSTLHCHAHDRNLKLTASASAERYQDRWPGCSRKS